MNLMNFIVMGQNGIYYRLILYKSKDIIGGIRNDIPPEMDDETDLRFK